MQDISSNVELNDNLVLSNDSPEVSFWFDDYYVAVVWNELVLGYDAHIYKQNCDEQLIHYTTTGGKSLEQASKHARQIILGKTQSLT